VTDTNKGLAAIYLTVLLLATNGLFAKGLTIGSIDITVIRGVIAAGTLAILAPFLGIRLFEIQRSDLIKLMFLGLLLTVHWAAFFEAMRVSSVAVGMAVLYTYPVFTVFFEAVVYRNRVDPADLFLAVFVVVGIFTISPPVGGDHQILLGVAWGLFSAITFALRNVLQRKHFKHIQPVAAVSYQSLAGSLLLLPFMSSEALPQASSAFGYLLLLGVVFTALPHTLLATSLRYLSAKTVSFIGCLQPVIGATIALAILGEVPALNVVLGGMIIVSAAMLETLKSVLKQRQILQRSAK
jgi:drug/metabolite transporter (DMT)-like permease